MKKRKKKSKDITKSKNRNLSVVQQRELESKIRNLIGRNYSDLEILEELNLQPHILKQYYLRILDIDQEKYNNMTSVEVYTKFSEGCRHNIKELDKMLKRFKFKHQFTATVAAVKQKHDIMKDQIKLGQQLGFIENQGSEASVEAEMMFATMSTEDVKKEINDEVARLNEMANGNVIEMRPELLAALESDEEKVRKFIPTGSIQEVKTEKPKRKIKIKLKLRKRL